MTLRARFVDSISDTATVRLDLTADPWRVLRSSRFDPPGIKRSRVSTLLTDGSQYPASAYDDRVLELHLQMREGSRDDAAAAVQDLARELDRHEQNFFEYRLTDQAESVFFRTFRLAMERIEYITDGTFQNIICPVIAEPFGYGLEQDLGTITVHNDPAAIANPTYFDASDVLGDVEAPMRIKKEVTGTPPLTAFPSTDLFAMRRRGTVADVPYLLQAEDMTQGTDTSVQSNDSDMSGADSNYSQCDFSTDATLVERLDVNEHPSSPSVDVRGTYRIFGRFRKSVIDDGIRVQIIAGGPDAGATTELPVVDLEDTTNEVLVDLGLLQAPIGTGVRYNGPSGEEMAAEGVHIELHAARDSGSGTLDIDYLLLVPADDRLAIVELTASWGVSSDSGVVFDSYHDLLYVHRDTGDQVVNKGIGQVTGALPMLMPGVTNRIYYLDGVDPGVANLVANSQTLELSYWPRYLSIRGD